MRIDKFTSCENSRSNWLKTGARYLQPLCDYFKQKLLKAKSILHIDETWCRVRIKYKGDGTIHSDGYVVYKHLARSNPENVHLLCWAHVRAKFKYVEEISKDPDAGWFVDQIGLLYMVEAENIKLHRSALRYKATPVKS